MANLLAYYLLNPGFVEALYDRLFELNAEILARCTAAGVDRTSIGYNIAMQDRLIVEPRGAASTKPCLAATIARLQGHQSRRPRLPSQ